MSGNEWCFEIFFLGGHSLSANSVDNYYVFDENYTKKN